MAYDRTIPLADDPVRAERLSQWARRKPRVALMGEFSAGKSTLLNFLVEADVLPTRATATEVPPVWFSHGDQGSYWVDEAGDRHTVTLAEIVDVPMSARYVRVFSTAEILEHCDIVDTPGISDPNLAAESWRFAAGVANMVLWCSSATQAWRETERSAWLSLPERLRRHSLIIVTRVDKLHTENDREKVRRRLARETTGMFHDMVFMATPDAVRAKADLARGESSPLWEESGAATLLDRLAERFEAIYADRGALLRRHLTGEGAPEPEFEAPPEPEPEVAPEPVSVGPRPVRVRVGGPRRTERLRPEDADAVMARLQGETAAAAALSNEDRSSGEPKAEPLVLRDAISAADSAEHAEAGDTVAETPVTDETAADRADGTAQAHQARPGYAMWFGARGVVAEEAEEAATAPEDVVGETAQMPADADFVQPGMEADADDLAEEMAEGIVDEAADPVARPDTPPVADGDDADDDVLMKALLGQKGDAEADMTAEAPADVDGVASDGLSGGPDGDAEMLHALASSFGGAFAEPSQAVREDAEAAEPGTPADLVDEAEPAASWTFASEEDERTEAVAGTEAGENEAPAAEPVEGWGADPEDTGEIARAPAGDEEAFAAVADDTDQSDLAEVEAAVAAAVEDGVEDDSPRDQPEAFAAPEAARDEIAEEDNGSLPSAAAQTVPAAVQAWRAIVARTDLLPGNEQIAAMIDELLMVLEQDAEEAVESGVIETDLVEAAGAELAEQASGMEPRPETDPETDPETEPETDPEIDPESSVTPDGAGGDDGSLTGWRRLA